MTLEKIMREYLRTHDHERFLAEVKKLRPVPREADIWKMYEQVKQS